METSVEREKAKYLFKKQLLPRFSLFGGNRPVEFSERENKVCLVQNAT